MPKNRKKVKGSLTDEQIGSIKKYFANNFENVSMKKVYYGMFLFDLNTGLRVGELTALNISDVWTGDEPREMLIVREETAKGNKQRSIPLNSTCQDVIKSLMKFYEDKELSTGGKTPLFKSRQRNSDGERRISDRSFQNKLKEINDELWERNELNVDLTPHTLRHTFLTNVYRKTKDIRTVQELAGHSDVSTTQIYTHVGQEEKKEAVEQLD